MYGFNFVLNYILNNLEEGMFNIVLEILDVENSVVRLVVVEVICQLMEIMGFDSYKMCIFYFGDIEEFYQ